MTIRIHRCCCLLLLLFVVREMGYECRVGEWMGVCNTLKHLCVCSSVCHSSKCQTTQCGWLVGWMDIPDKCEWVTKTKNRSCEICSTLHHFNAKRNPNVVWKQRCQGVACDSPAINARCHNMFQVPKTLPRKRLDI